MGPLKSPICYHNLQLLSELCTTLGVPLAHNKVEGPSTTLEFLRILIDTIKMETRLPEEKLSRAQTTVKKWLHKKNATKQEILSLVGILQHAAKVQELDYSTRLNKLQIRPILVAHLHNTLEWYLLPAPEYPTLSIQTDASGSCGGGGFFNGKWFQIHWQKEWVIQAIMAKEVMPIVVSCAIWGCYLSKQSILFQCDNTGVVAAIKKGLLKGTCSDESIAHIMVFCSPF